MNVLDLCTFFSAIDKEMSELIFKADSLAENGIGKESWDKYKELEQIRNQKIINNLPICYKGDEMFDEVHDAILCYADGFSKMPDGYSATIICSYYCSIMQHYQTIAVVNTPNNTEYLINVPTFDKLIIGTKIETIKL